jgi:dTDP-4-dehydrorhamnose reductase
MTKRILITGANGQLGRCLQVAGKSWPAYQLIFVDRNQCNIGSAEDIQRVMQHYKPDTVINCAAYTAVDTAEHDVETAMLINKLAPAILAKSCAKFNSKLIHISTDYVFNGQASSPYHEADATSPINVYGCSKLAGEEAVLNSGAQAIIIRTGWLYSEFSHNFCNTMLRLSAEKKQISVVSDQIGTPTYARHLADTLLQIVSHRNFVAHNNIQKRYHFANHGVASWYDFAHSIVQLSGSSCQIKPVPTSAYPTPANRPAYSVLDKTLITKDFDLDIMHWRDALAQCLQHPG